MTQALLDVDPVILMEFTPELECEGYDHHRGIHGHVPDSPGAFFVTAPCCGPKVVVCAPRVAAMRFNGLLTCHTCRREHLTEAYTILPI